MQMDIHALAEGDGFGLVNVHALVLAGLTCNEMRLALELQNARGAERETRSWGSANITLELSSRC